MAKLYAIISNAELDSYGEEVAYLALERLDETLQQRLDAAR